MEQKTKCENIKKSILELLCEKIKINKPIRLIEFFAGYGSQALSLKYLGVPFESWKICEWAVKSIQAYKDIHFGNDTTDYVSSNNMNQSQVENYLFKLGISNNYNDPMTLKQIQSKGFAWQKKVLNNIISTHNLVNIQRVKAKHLNIIDTNIYDYILCYSFPCQDLSLAGNRKGMSDTSTRSGMLWEVERILKELYDQDIHIPILLMENVPQVHSKTNINDFNKWTSSLEQMGYKNYFQDLNAKDYGVPQNRKRCFMISILNYDGDFKFPEKQELKVKLRDLLEDEVDEKYFLSNKLIDCFTDMKNRNGLIRGLRFRPKGKDEDYALTITTHAGSRPTDNYIIEPIPAALRGRYESDGKIKQHLEIKDDGNTNTITTVQKDNLIIVPEATKKGYALAKEGDGIYTNRVQFKRGVVQKDKIPTLKTSPNDVAVVTKDINNLISIRRLTPRECGRLMGVSEKDITIMSKNQSNSSLYHLFGDSIVINVLMAIFREML